MLACQRISKVVGVSGYNYYVVALGHCRRSVMENPHILLIAHIFIIITSVHVGFASECPVDWDSVSGGCYRAFTEDSQFASAYDARQFCLQHGADMASFPDYETQVNVTNQLTAEAETPMYTYIGVWNIYDETSFHWLDSNDSASYMNFSDPDYIESYYNQRCVAVTSPELDWSSSNHKTSWVTVPCCFDTLSINSVVCRKPDNGNVTMAPSNDTLYQHCFGGCDDGWYHFDGYCYSVVSTQTDDVNSTYQARKACSSVGADLPALRSEGVEKHVASLMRLTNATERSSNIYFGENDAAADGSFVSLEGDPLMGGITWAQGEPSNGTSENCIMMTSPDGNWTNGNWAWFDVPCCSKQNVTQVVCQKPADGESTAPVSADDDILAVECFSGFINVTSCAAHALCEDIDDCLNSSCQNNATCTDRVLGYNCSCMDGYNGTLCENEINFCLSNPCQNDATCKREVGGYTCQCVYGYDGNYCEILVDECISNPCQNNATCIDGDEGYNCSCALGFEGTLCETNIDDCVNTTCNNNGTCVDQIGYATCKCPVNYAGTYCETEIECDTSISVENATRANESNVGYYNGWIRFECNPGMKFPDMDRAKTVKCLHSGWDLDPSLACEPHCDYVPDVAHATVEKPSSRVGTMLNYTCEEGFRFADNSTEKNTTCLAGGLWDGHIDNDTACKLVLCPELPDWPYQEVDTYNNTYNTTVTFWCDVGYVLHDNTTARTIKCLSDGDWTADLPPCEPVRCPVIELTDGLSANTSAHTYNTYARYECNDDKRMLDGATYRIIKCDASAEWSDNITDCRADRCFPLPYVANATPSTTDADFGIESVLTCIKGHRFNPGKARSKSMTCKTNGWWDPILSECQPVLCDVIPRSNNTIPSTENQLFGTVVDYACIKGHYMDLNTLENSETIECMETEAWNMSSIRDCWPIVCEAPPNVTNGTIELPENRNYSSLVHYDCDVGFKFIDGRTKKNLYCNEYGNWNESDVSCRKDRCDPVPRPANTWPDTTNTSWYTNVTYRCDIGYEWPENKTTHGIMCQAGGVWTQTQAHIPPCTIKECPQVDLMQNATVNDTDNHVYNTYVEYACDVGFKFPDNSTEKLRWCSDQAVWEPVDFPACEIIYCPELEDVENATRDSNDTYYNKEVMYTCMNGYQYPDKTLSKSVVCTANETWTEYPPPCEVVFCPPVPEWGAAIFNSTVNEFLAVVTYYCPSNFSFADSVEVTDETVEVELEKMSMCLESKVWDPPFVECVSLFSINQDLIGVVYESPEGVHIATVACTLLCLLLASIILLDLNKLYMDIKMMKSNISSLIKARKNRVDDSSTCATNKA